MGLLFSFEGRIGRLAWWMCMLGIAIVGGIAEAKLMPNPEAETSSGLGMLVLINIALFWCYLAVSVKRWHDRDKSGWWVLIGFIPVIGFIWIIVENGILSGTEGENRFGSSPNG